MQGRGSCIDYALLHPVLAGSARVEVDATAPWSPHKGVRVHLAAAAIEARERRLVAADELPWGTAGAAPRPWEATATPAAAEAPKARAHTADPVPCVHAAGSVDPDLTERYARFARLHGDAWAARMFGSRNVVIFPNLAIVDLGMGITIRTYEPLAADSMEVTAWSIAPSDDHPELARMRRENFLTFWGPAGLATPDDIEALERCQLGFAARDAAPWNDISRGMVRANPLTTDELQMRTFWREWDRRMTGTVHPPEVPVSPRAGRVALPYEARTQSAGLR